MFPCHPGNKAQVSFTNHSPPVQTPPEGRWPSSSTSRLGTTGKKSPQSKGKRRYHRTICQSSKGSCSSPLDVLHTPSCLKRWSAPSYCLSSTWQLTPWSGICTSGQSTWDETTCWQITSVLGCRSHHPLVRRVVNKCVYCQQRSPPMCLAQSRPAYRPSYPREPSLHQCGMDSFGSIPIKRKKKREVPMHLHVHHHQSHSHWGSRFSRHQLLPQLHLQVHGQACWTQVDMLRQRKELCRGRVGAQTRLEQWNQARIQDKFNDWQIKWLFNLPLASHVDRVWERQIQTGRESVSRPHQGTGSNIQYAGHAPGNRRRTVQSGQHRPISAIWKDLGAIYSPAPPPNSPPSNSAIQTFQRWWFDSGSGDKSSTWQTSSSDTGLGNTSSSTSKPSGTSPRGMFSQETSSSWSPHHG